MGRHHTGEQVHPVQLIGRIQVQVGVRVVEALIFVLGDGGEHAAGLHIVPVQQVVLGGKVGIAAPIQEDGTVLVAGAVDIAVQVVLAALLRRLDDGVVDAGVGAVDPAHHVRILGLQRGEVHGDVVGLAAGAAVGVAVGVVIGRRDRCHHLIDQILLALFAFLFLHHIADDLHRGEHQYTQQNGQHTVVQHLAAFMLLAAPSGSVAVVGGAVLGPLVAHTGAPLLAASVRSFVHVTSLLALQAL